MSVAINPLSRYILELRMGRINGIMDFLDKNPSLINQKIKSSPTAHESFLELATRFDQTNTVLLLHSRGAVETQETAPSLLARALLHSNDRLIALFTDWGWDPWKGSSADNLPAPIETAVNLGYMHALTLWDKKGIDFAQTNDKGNNLLHSLMTYFALQVFDDKRMDVARWLMKKGVAWDAPNSEGLTPGDLCVDPKWAAQLTDSWDEVCAIKTKKALKNALSAASSPAVKKRRM